VKDLVALTSLPSSVCSTPSVPRALLSPTRRRSLAGALALTLTAAVALVPGLSPSAGADVAGVVTNIAGTGSSGFSGDGGAATAAKLAAPRHLVMAGDGSLYVADGGNHRIRRIAPDGTITTVAGTGTAGSSGDGGPATAAAINTPHAVAVDAAGNLFIADSMSARIRKVTPGGTITTVAGTGVEGFSGDGGPGTAAKLRNPKGLEIGPDGALYISDGLNHRVRRLGLDGTITTVAGNGAAASAGDGGPATAASIRVPRGLDFDAGGNLYVAEGDGHRVRRIALDGTITTVAGTGTAGYNGDLIPATSAQLTDPHGVVVDGSGRLFVADSDNHRIRMIETDGTISTVSGTGAAANGAGNAVAVYSAIANPRGLAVDAAGDVYIADTGNNRIRKVTGPTAAPPGLSVGSARPVAETDAVAGTGDAADDPAIWVDPADPTRSLVIGTDKATDYLEVYDLSGRRLQRLHDRNSTLNNVDVQGNFSLGGRTVGLVATSGSDLGFYAIDPDTRQLTEVTPDTVVRPTHGVAGVCLYTSPQSGKTYAFAAAGNGNVQQFEITAGPDGKVRAVSVRGPWDVNPAPDYEPHDGEMEACAVDDETGTLYVAEQAMAVWAYGAEPTDPTDPANRTLVTSTSAYNGGPGSADLEGIAVVGGPDGTGWVIVSSQASNSYIVVERAAPHAYVRTVTVASAGQVDGCTFTDGIDAVAADLGGYFQAGLFVCQDNTNTLAGGGGANQNFKLVPLHEIVPLPNPDGTVPSTTTTSSSSTTTTKPTTTTSTSTTTTSTTSTSTTTTTTNSTTTSTASTSTTTATVQQPVTTSTTAPLGPPDPGFGRAGSRSGYWMVDTAGHVYPFGEAADLGGPVGRLAPGAAAVDLEPTPTSAGYWVLADDGSVHRFGDATALRDLAGTLRAGEKAAALSATPSGRGYWIFTTKGRVAAFGDAPSFGDVSTLTLAGPVLDSIATPTGAGYYMVASDGGIFAFGDARFYGSMGGKKLNAPVQSLVPDPDGVGYWLVAADGGVFAFEAGFRGSMGGRPLNAPVTGMVPYGNGYLMVATDGGVFNFSTLPFSGSLGGTPPARPIVAVAARRG
jgi:myo-inositol-hexaphosphate 3-phosphohydrolase